MCIDLKYYLHDEPEAPKGVASEQEETTLDPNEARMGLGLMLLMADWRVTQEVMTAKDFEGGSFVQCKDYGTSQAYHYAH